MTVKIGERDNYRMTSSGSAPKKHFHLAAKAEEKLHLETPKVKADLNRVYLYSWKLKLLFLF